MTIASVLRESFGQIASDGMSVFEIGLVVLSLLASWTLPDRIFRFGRSRAYFARIARRKALSVGIVGFLCIALRLALLPILPVPVPGVHDEYSYLLAGDTFAHGRLTNPTPALWQPFESFHIMMVPSYASKFFPIQGLFLAAGKILTGCYWSGVLVSAALMCAAICWMLQAYLPPQWALLGGLLAVLRLGTLSAWANTYWGGAATALGGALVLGAVARLIRSRRPLDSFFLGLGVALLMCSRPFEGFFFLVPSAAVLSWSLLGRRNGGSRSKVLPALLPFAATVLIAVSLLAYYNWRVVGNPLKFPHQVEQAQYGVGPLLVLGHLAPVPQFRHAVMQDFFVNVEPKSYLDMRSFGGFVGETWKKAFVVLSFFVGPTFLLPCFWVRWAIFDRKMKLLVCTVAITCTALVLEVRLFPHYAAPMTAAIWALLLQTMRHMSTFKYRGKAVGKALASTVILCAALEFALWVGLSIAGRAPSKWHWTWDSDWTGNIERAELMQALQKRPGKQLVLVSYSSGHNSLAEWVYNPSDIEHAKVVWARDMGTPQNQKLIVYLNGPTVWMFRPDENPEKLESYSATGGPPGVASSVEVPERQPVPTCLGCRPL